jgi:antitoxin component of MazEF toxin-antitoxin module
MKVQIQKVGDDMVVLLPPKIAQDFGFLSSGTVTATVDERGITVHGAHSGDVSASAVGDGPPRRRRDECPPE